ncbi:MAG: SRPBCC family protein [Acidimicrobiales bacterium]
MVDIRHRIGIAAPLPEVYAAVATTPGLRSWWTADVTGESVVGGSLQFYFGTPEPSAEFQVVDLVPDRLLAWRCAGGPDDWVDTTLTVDLTPSDGETVLLFTHGGWKEATEFMGHCSTKWAVFLLGMKSLLEGGPSVAFPNDPPISSWG